MLRLSTLPAIPRPPVVFDDDEGRILDAEALFRRCNAAEERVKELEAEGARMKNMAGDLKCQCIALTREVEDMGGRIAELEADNAKMYVELTVKDGAALMGISPAMIAGCGPGVPAPVSPPPCDRRLHGRCLRPDVCVRHHRRRRTGAGSWRRCNRSQLRSQWRRAAGAQCSAEDREGGTEPPLPREAWLRAPAPGVRRGRRWHGHDRRKDRLLGA